MKKTVLSLSVLIGLCASSLSSADSLLDIYKLAKQHDPQILGAAAARDAGKEAVPQARSALLPQLQGQYSVGRRESSRTGNNGELGFTTPIDSESSNDESGFTLSLRQQIYHHDSWIALSQADKSATRADLEYTAAEQALIVRVAQAYFDVLSAEDDVKYNNSNKEAIGRQLEQTKQRFNVGLIAITDVHEAQARFDQAVSDEIAAKNKFDTANEALREITARYHDSLAKLTLELPLNSPAPASVDDWIKFSETQNPGLAAQKLATEVSRDEVSRRFAGHLPSADLVARHERGNTNGDGSGLDFRTGQKGTTTSDVDSELTSISLDFNIPIFSGGLTSSQVREGEALYTQSTQVLEQRHRAVIKDTKTAYLGVEASIAGVKALQQQVVSSKSALEATQAGFEVGTRTIVDVLDSTRNVYLAERNLAQAKYNYILNGLRLKQAGGIIKEADLAAINTLLR